MLVDRAHPSHSGSRGSLSYLRFVHAAILSSLRRTDRGDRPRGSRQPRVVFDFTVAGGKIVEIDLLADPTRLGQLDVELLDR
ncbi:MAG: hypothetical protein ACRDN9_16665 [Streptosporangiaceae bacterium]